MREEQARKPVHACPMQILADHTLIVPLTATVEQPIGVPCVQMNGRSRPEIQDGDPGDQLFGPMRGFDIKMSARNLREQMDDPDNERGQRPVGVIKNHSNPRQQGR